MEKYTAILSTENLSVGYKNGNKTTEIISGLNLQLNRGELVCLIGSNGIGKSTLLRTLSGTQVPLSGSIKIGHADISLCSRKELSRLISIVYTDRTLAGALTVEEVVGLGRQPYTGFFGRLDENDKKIISSVLDEVGMLNKAQQYIATLSDGERQKTMIARALAQRTPIVILDEPTAFLDIASSIETMKLLHSLAHKYDKAILLSSHDICQSLTLADRLWLLHNNHTIHTGVTEELILNGDLEKLFGDRNITFNYISGNFYPNQNFNKYISLNCEDSTLKQWIINILNRNEIGIKDDALDNIIAYSKSDIRFNSVKFDSISLFIDYIKSSI